MNPLLLLSLFITCTILYGCQKESDAETTLPASKHTIDYDSYYVQLKQANSNSQPLVSRSGKELDSFVKNGLRLFLAPSEDRSEPIKAEDRKSRARATGRTRVRSSSPATPQNSDYFYSILSRASYFNPQPKGGFKVVRLHSPESSATFTAIYSDKSDAKGFEQKLGEVKIQDCLDVGSTASTTCNNTRPGPRAITSRDSNFEVIPSVQDLYRTINKLFLHQTNQRTSNVITIKALAESYRSKFSGVRIQSVDTSVPSTPSLHWSLDIEGDYLDSQKVGNTVYIVSQKNLYGWDKLIREEGDDLPTRIQNEGELNDFNYSSFSPQYRYNDNKTQNLSTNCLIQHSPHEGWGQLNYTYITAINLNNRKIHSTCIGGHIDTINMNTKAAYISSNISPDKIIIHKLDLTNGQAQYAATGSLPGNIHYFEPQASSIAMTDTQLRVFTKNSQGTISFNILEQKQNLLMPVAQLPSDSSPAPLTNFSPYDGQISYVASKIPMLKYTNITQAILDLSDYLDPKWIPAQSHLTELPLTNRKGYYLNHRYFLSVDTTGTTKTSKPIAFELLDLSSKSATILSSLSINNEFRSLSSKIEFIRINNDQLRFTFPFSDQENGISLKMIEVNGLLSDSAELNDMGNISSGHNSLGAVISYIHDGTVYFTFNNGTWATPWAQPNNTIGPIKKTPCSLIPTPGIEVTLVNANGESAQALCDAKITIRNYANQPPHEEVLTLVSNSITDKECVFVGAMDRPDLYRLHISVLGQSFSKSYNGSDIVVYTHPTYCGVITGKLKASIRLNEETNSES